MRHYQIAVIPGDGIGPEVITESVYTLDVLAQLQGGASRKTVARSILRVAGGVRRVRSLLSIPGNASPQRRVTLYYRGLLDREVDASGLASRDLIRISYCSFSQMRGTPKKKLGPISRRFCVTVSIDSAKYTTVP